MENSVVTPTHPQDHQSYHHDLDDLKIIERPVGHNSVVLIVQEITVLS